VSRGGLRSRKGALGVRGGETIVSAGGENLKKGLVYSKKVKNEERPHNIMRGGNSRRARTTLDRKPKRRGQKAGEENILLRYGKIATITVRRGKRQKG